MIKLDPPLPWEVIAPPGVMKIYDRSGKAISTIADSTISWSSTPTFTLFSVGLGVESLEVTAALGRPVLILVFAPSNGFVEEDEAKESLTSENLEHHYEMKVCPNDLVVGYLDQYGGF